MTTFNGFINPLRCFDIEGLPGHDSAVPTIEQILAYMVAHGSDGSIDAIVARYQEIIEAGKVLIIAPTDVPNVLEKLFWPLRHAIASYMMCNNLAVIAQSGYVAEMVAILWLDMANFQINGQPISESQIKKLYGRTFEKMSQDQRVKVLDAYGLVNEKTKNAFDKVRDVRRKYLHLLSHPHDNIVLDSRTAFGCAATLVHSVLGLGLGNGSITFSPLFKVWMEKHMPELPNQQGAEPDAPTGAD